MLWYRSVIMSHTHPSPSLSAAFSYIKACYCFKLYIVPPCSEQFSLLPVMIIFLHSVSKYGMYLDISKYAETKVVGLVCLALANCSDEMFSYIASILNDQLN